MTRQNNDANISDILSAQLNRRRLMRFTLTGATAAVAVGLLAACGGDDDDDDTPATTTGGGQATTAATESGGGTTPASGGSTPAAGGGATATTSAETPAAGSGDDTPIVIAQGVDIATFDPHEDTSSSAISIFENVFDHLVQRSAELELVPSLAETWENVDELTWEFKLREDVVFHDGTPFTAKDMQFTFEHVMDPAVQSREATRISMVDRVEAPDDYTFRIITKMPFPALLTVLGYIFAVPADKYQEMGAEEFALNPIGTGPYKFVEWIKDDHVTLELVPDNWRQGATISSVEFRPIPEAATRVAALQAGEIQVATLIPVTDVPVINSSDTAEIRSVDSLRTIFVGINTFAEPFTDVRVRQALNYAVDVQSIIDNLLDGHSKRIASVCGPAEFGFDPDLEPYEYDPDRARELLAEAGFADGFSTTLDTPIGRYLQDVEVSQVIAGQLGEVGIQVEVRPAEFQEYFDRWLAKEIEGLYFLGYGASTMDADGVMGSHLDSTRRGLYYNSPESDALIAEAATEFDVQRREEIYHELMAYFKEQAPWIFLYTQEDIYGVARDLIWAPRSDERLWVPDMHWS